MKMEVKINIFNRGCFCTLFLLQSLLLFERMFDLKCPILYLDHFRLWLSTSKSDRNVRRRASVLLNRETRGGKAFDIFLFVFRSCSESVGVFIRRVFAADRPAGVHTSAGSEAHGRTLRGQKSSATEH